MTKLEEVARAICCPNGCTSQKPDIDLACAAPEYRSEARAAIAAMREPTEAMLFGSQHALADYIDNLPPDERQKFEGIKGGLRIDSRVKARIRFMAMIDAILQEDGAQAAE